MLGWVVHYRLQRSASRKQHTFTVLLSVSFNDTYHHKHWDAIVPIVRGDGLNVNVDIGPPDKDTHDRNPSVKFVLNHFEKIAAGIRNGDISEGMVKDAQRGTFISLFSSFEEYIFAARARRGREAVYEHLEWLYDRWHKKPPGFWCGVFEFFKGCPLQGKRNNINNHG